MASRNLDDLQPEVANAAQQHLLACAEAGIEILIYCTLRDAEEQARLFCQHRSEEQIARRRDQIRNKGFDQLADLLTPPQTVQGSKVTNAGPGQSFHQYGLAYDCVPMIAGKCLWKTTGDAAGIWQQVGQLGKASGLEWAGDWRRFREFPHFQITSGRTISDLMQEKYGASQPAILTAVDLSQNTESEALRAALDEPNTKFMIIASVPGVSEQELMQLNSTAGLVRNLNPAVRRLFWIKQPDDLSAELKNLLWQVGEPAVGTVISLGNGMARQVKTFTLSQLDSTIDVFQAFNWEP